MTNNQRDELLISLAKGVNNLQSAFNDFRTEVRAEFNRLENKYDTKIDNIEQKLNQNIEKTDALAEDYKEIKATVGTLTQDSKEIKATVGALVEENKGIKANVEQNSKRIDSLAKDVAETKQFAKENIKAISEVFRDFVKFNSETTLHLEKHDEQIAELQAKLA